MFIHSFIHLKTTIQCQDAALAILRSIRPNPCPEKIPLWGEDREVKRPLSHGNTECHGHAEERLRRWGGVGKGFPQEGTQKGLSRPEPET